jgi:hypothetical protein
VSITFYVVYQILEWLALATGLSYEEINIIVFYVIIPSVFFALIDKILHKPVFLLAFSTLLLITFTQIRDFSLFSEQLFDWSVRFLLGFSHLGIGYDKASVFVCVLVPILLLIILCRFAFPSTFERHLPTVALWLSKSMHQSDKRIQ